MQVSRFPLGMLWTNCYVIYGETKDAIVVDPGGPAAEVRDFLRDRGLVLRWILLTHGHGDHIMGLGDLRDISSNGVAIHAEDADCLMDAGENLSRELGHPVTFKAADLLLKDGDELTVGEMKIRVIYTPGHTRGGSCFYITEGADALLVSGDTLFARSVGRSDLPGGDESVLLDSLLKLNDFPDVLPVYPGHGPDTTIGEEKRLNPFWPR